MAGSYSLKYMRSFKPDLLARGGVLYQSDNKSQAQWEEEVSHTSAGTVYCTRIPAVQSQPRPTSLYRGLIVLLSDAHANNNIGHAAYDMMFLAHLLSRRGSPDALPIRHVLVRDPLHPLGRGASKSAYAHRMEGLRALIAGQLPPSVFDEMNGTGPPFPCCEVVAQKASGFVGDWRAGQLYRSQAYRHCAVARGTAATHILIERHGGTSRQWAAASLRLMNATLRSQRWARGLDLVVTGFGHLGFCEQVHLP